MHRKETLLQQWGRLDHIGRTRNVNQHQGSMTDCSPQTNLNVLNCQHRSLLCSHKGVDGRAGVHHSRTAAPPEGAAAAASTLAHHYGISFFTFQGTRDFTIVGPHKHHLISTIPSFSLLCCHLLRPASISLTSPHQVLSSRRSHQDSRLDNTPNSDVRRCQAQRTPDWTKPDGASLISRCQPHGSYWQGPSDATASFTR